MAANPAHTGTERYNYHLMWLTNTEAEDLKILPTHRLIKDIVGLDEAAFLKKLDRHFTVKPVSNPDHMDEIIAGGLEPETGGLGKFHDVGTIAGEKPPTYLRLLFFLHQVQVVILFPGGEKCLLAVVETDGQCLVILSQHQVGPVNGISQSVHQRGAYPRATEIDEVEYSGFVEHITQDHRISVLDDKSFIQAVISLFWIIEADHTKSLNGFYQEMVDFLIWSFEGWFVFIMLMGRKA